MRPHGTRARYIAGCRCARCRDANTDYMMAYRYPLEPDDPRHGTVNGYANHGCRCDPCRRAVAEYRRRYADLPADDPRHGSIGTYTAGCRCQRCRDALASYRASHRVRTGRR